MVRTGDGGSPPPRVQFHYVWTPGYREVACHGVTGHVTPQGKLWMALYSERASAPSMVEFEAVPAPDTPGALRVNERSPPVRIESTQGVVRSIELGVYLDLGAAERLHAWLGESIRLMQRK
jgi:hypothetical protein